MDRCCFVTARACAAGATVLPDAGGGDVRKLRKTIEEFSEMVTDEGAEQGDRIAFLDIGVGAVGKLLRGVTQPLGKGRLSREGVVGHGMFLE